MAFFFFNQTKVNCNFPKQITRDLLYHSQPVVHVLWHNICWRKIAWSVFKWDASCLWQPSGGHYWDDTMDVFELCSGHGGNVCSHSRTKQAMAPLLQLNQRPIQRGKWHAATKIDGDGSLNDPFSQASVYSTHGHLEGASIDSRRVRVCFFYGVSFLCCYQF